MGSLYAENSSPYIQEIVNYTVVSISGILWRSEADSYGWSKLIAYQ